ILLWCLSWISLSSSFRDKSIVRYTRSSASRSSPSNVRDASADPACAGASLPLTTDDFIRANYSIQAGWYILRRIMSVQTVRLHRWDEIALEKVTEMVSRKIVTGEREMLAQVYLKRGCLVPMHSHESEQMTYILQGALRFVIGGEEITVREGEVLHIPSAVEHQAEALEDTFELDV